MQRKPNQTPGREKPSSPLTDTNAVLASLMAVPEPLQVVDPAAKETIRVAAYVRVSTDEQARDGFSLDAQLEDIRRFVQVKGWEIVQEYCDEEGHTLVSVEEKDGVLHIKVIKKDM